MKRNFLRLLLHSESASWCPLLDGWFDEFPGLKTVAPAMARSVPQVRMNQKLVDPAAQPSQVFQGLREALRGRLHPACDVADISTRTAALWRISRIE